MDLAPWEPQALGVGGMQRLKLLKVPKLLKVLKLLQAAASAKFAFANAFAFAFAFAFASPTTTTWLPTHQAFGQWSKGGLGKARLR